MKKKEDNFELQVPRFENPFENFDILDETEKYVSERLLEDGFCVIDFPCENFDDLAEELIYKLTKHFKKEASSEKILPGQRIQDALDIKEVLDVAGNKRIMEILSNVYGKKSFPFQTLNFPASTEQISHSDHVHFDSIPHRFMAGVWVAFEDITEDNGALFYYPGSHKWPALYNTEVSHHQIDDSNDHYDRFPISWDRYAEHYGVSKEHFYAKKGQCLIWHSNLVHGGSKQKDQNASRWSQVTHYYFDDCAYYTPLLSNQLTGKYNWRKIYDLITKEYKPNIVNGHEMVTKDSIFDDNFSFDPDTYLELNPDVKESGDDPYKHFLEFGVHEGRKIN